MTDPRAGKTYSLTWEQWVEYCAEHNINPHQQCEDGYDLGGGDSFTVACHDKPPKEYEEPAPAKLQNCKCQIIKPEDLEG